MQIAILLTCISTLFLLFVNFCATMSNGERLYEVFTSFKFGRWTTCSKEFEFVEGSFYLIMLKDTMYKNRSYTHCLLKAEHDLIIAQFSHGLLKVITPSANPNYIYDRLIAYDQIDYLMPFPPPKYYER